MKLGKFEVLAELGQGAMGKVYRALDPALDRQVALKTISAGFLATPEAAARFQREARAAARLAHPNIVTIYELGEVEGAPYIAMELIEGIDFGQVVSPPERFPLGEKVRMIAEVCRGLDFAHKQGVVHRDVKPANVRLGRDGAVKILDFGIARLADSEMTQVGTLLGTPTYMSPEALRTGKVDHRSDMWATGVILYEVLAGRRPFQAETTTSLVFKIVHEPLPPLDHRALDVPEALARVADRALQKEPAARFVDLAEMARALLGAIGATPPAEPALDQEARQQLFERSCEEARQRLAAHDLSGALAAARRAQSLDPSRTGIAVLIADIEGRLQGGVAMPGSERTVAATTAGALGTLGAAAWRELAVFGEPPATQAMALSPVKDVLALAGSDGAVRLWDLQTRARIATLRTDLHQRTGHEALALALAFSPDGALLASAHVDGAARLWDVGSGRLLPARLRHDGVVGALAFSPDGVTLATGSVDSTLRLWDVRAAVAGDARRELFRQPAGITALTYAGAGTWILTAHGNRVLRLQDARSGRLVATLRGPEGVVTLLRASPPGTLAAAASQDRSLRLFDLESKEQKAVLTGFKRPATGLAFLGDGLHLASVSQANAVDFWDLESAAHKATLWGRPEESFVGVALAASGEMVVALAEGRIRLWGLAG